MADSPPAPTGPAPAYGSPSSLAITTVAPPRPQRTLYFAYGSDMQIAYMARTCPNSRYIGRAVLTDYKWHINGLGFANLTKVKTAHAPGLVFEVDDADKTALEKNKFPLYRSVTIDAELYPAPFCLYRRQATWITKHGGPEAVLEEAYATGRGNDRRASYTERGLLVFISLDVTTDGRPDARYAEAINAAAADAMALGIEPLFFEKIVQQFMPGRMLPYLRVVRRGRQGSVADTGAAATTTPTTDSKLSPVAARQQRAESSRTPSPSSPSPSQATAIIADAVPYAPTAKDRETLAGAAKVIDDAGDLDKFDISQVDIPVWPESERLAAAYAAKERERKEKEKEKEKEKGVKDSKPSGFGETIRTIFNRQRGRRKESNESGEGSGAAAREAREAAGGRRSPLLTGSESGNASGSDDGSTSPTVNTNTAARKRPEIIQTAKGSLYRLQKDPSYYAVAADFPARRNVSASSSATALQGNSATEGAKHSKSQSESSLVDTTTRPPAPKITISRPSRHNTIDRTKWNVDPDDGDEDSTDSEIESEKEKKEAASSSRKTEWRKSRQIVVSPPPRPSRPPPERANPVPSGYVPVYSVAAQKKTAGESVRQVDPAVVGREQTVVPTVGTIRRDTLGRDKTTTEGASGSSSRLAVERKPVKAPGKKRPSTDEVLRMRAAANRAFTAGIIVKNKPSPVEPSEAARKAREVAKEMVDAEREEKAETDTKEIEKTSAPPPPKREAPKGPRAPPTTPPRLPAEKPVKVEEEEDETTETAQENPEETVTEKAEPTQVSAPATRVSTTPLLPRPSPTPAVTVRLPFVPRRPVQRRFGVRQSAAATSTEKEHLLRRPKSFCGAARPLTRFDRFLLQAAEHPHFSEKAWLQVFRQRQQQHSHFAFHAQVHVHTHAHTPRHRMMFAASQTTVVGGAFGGRERRMSF
ncbi:hypothetical protein Sste5346_006114 [Sporothrix stenoceras]|uniref:gamma-glutamylcyclotransferase n=1 Tax=Sporothrix stenoceras TaxID=5173 RepID=A0ABR3Z0E8_9PEZI